jgi:hypothetical protein
MLFILAMEPLHRLFSKAQSLGLLDRLSLGCDTFRVSLYVDDIVIFIQPIEHDLKITTDILNTFAQVSGLVTNITKIACFPIQCDNINLEFISRSNMVMSQFPCKYLGLPLHHKKPSRSMLQSVNQKIGNRLLGWKGKLVSYPGSELLVKTILSTMPTFFLTVFKMPKCDIPPLSNDG